MRQLIIPAAYCPLTLTLVMLIMLLLPGDWQSKLEYQPHAIAQHELWRLFTCHLVHLGWGHLLMNLLGLWLLWELLLRFQITTADCVFGLALLGLVTSLGLYLFSPDIAWYRGFSGVLHGLLVWLSLRQLQRHPRSRAALLGLVICKLIWEQVSGPLPGSEAVVSGRIIVDTHLYGALAGALTWVLEQGISRINKEVSA